MIVHVKTNQINHQDTKSTKRFLHLLRALGVLVVVSPPVYAADWNDQAIPRKWVEQVAPEKGAKLELPDYANDFDRAKAEIFAGRYKRGLMMLRNDSSPQAVKWKARALATIGRENDALKLLNGPGMEVDRARVLMQMNRPAEAKTLLEKADTIDGHYVRGRANELLGDLDAARKDYGWFAEKYLPQWRENQEKGFDDAEAVTTIARGLDRWALLTNAYATDAALHGTILDMFVKAYDVIDRDYWPAHVAAAGYLLSHDDQPKAIEELKAAHHANPNDVESLKLQAQIAIEQFNFDGVDQAIDAIREINPNSTEADLLEARNLLLQRLPLEAETPIMRVLANQSRNLEAMGLLAAAKSLQTHDDEATAVLKKVEAIDADNASAYREVADQLAALRQYPRAIAMYQTVVKRAPWWTAARNELGLLYTQSGDEDEARKVLDEAHKNDPFNIKTTNYLRLLDKLQQFARSESAHFVVMYDAKLDPVIPEYFGQYLETIYSQVCAAYAHEPAVKTYIEVFPTHDAFSVRTTGTPWIGTVGASTGRVIALVAPRKAAKTQGPFNWSQVLRHEFTHTVTLSATENRIPHWMTEGLAVTQEQTPMRWEWVPMLYHAVKSDSLFPLDKLTWAFIRPRKPTDRPLGYAESFWLCSFIEQKWGHNSILKMLDEFRAGRRQEDVIIKVLNRNQDQLFAEFVAWAKQQTATWGYDDATSKKYEELALQGQQLIETRQYKEALAVWLEIAKLRPVDALPHKRLAGLYLSKDINDTDKAVEQLLLIHQMELKDDQYAKRAARVLRNAGKLDRAENLALQAVYIDPYDRDAHELLAELKEKRGDTAGSSRENKVIEMIENARAAQAE